MTLPWKRKSVKRVVCLFQQEGTRWILFCVFLHLMILCCRSFNYSKALMKSLLQRCDFSWMESLFFKTFFAGQAKNRTNKSFKCMKRTSALYVSFQKVFLLSSLFNLSTTVKISGSPYSSVVIFHWWRACFLKLFLLARQK